MAMSAEYLLIDGYNLLHAARLDPKSDHHGALARARRRLIVWLEELLTVHQRSRTTIVFDARDKTVDRPNSSRQAGMTILFARSHADADGLIQELLERHAQPGRVTLVTSDRQLARAARALGAATMTSQKFLERTFRRGQSRSAAEAKPDPGSDRVLHADYVRAFRQFVGPGGSPDEPAPLQPPAHGVTGRSSREKKKCQSSPARKRRRDPRSALDKKTSNPMMAEDFGDFSEFESQSAAEEPITQEQFDAWVKEIERDLHRQGRS